MRMASHNFTQLSKYLTVRNQHGLSSSLITIIGTSFHGVKAQQLKYFSKLWNYLRHPTEEVWLDRWIWTSPLAQGWWFIYCQRCIGSHGPKRLTLKEPDICYVIGLENSRSSLTGPCETPALFYTNMQDAGRNGRSTRLNPWKLEKIPLKFNEFINY